jgi:metallo-beta-lactamase class B
MRARVRTQLVLELARPIPRAVVLAVLSLAQNVRVELGKCRRSCECASFEFMQKISLLTITLALATGLARDSAAQANDSAYTAAECPRCATWNSPAAGVRLFGNTYFVGTRGLSAVLVTSSAGHVLIDAGLPDTPPLIVANIRALGFRVEDIKLIVSSHAHYDHVGGLAMMQRASGATVAASAQAAAALRAGKALEDDPQFAIALRFPRVQTVRVVADNDTLRVGSTAITVHFTPGHTPGGTSWSWRSCEGNDCRDFVYADSQTPVSADGFLFTQSTTSGVRQFERGQAVLDRLSCDILVTPHPEASQLWQRLDARSGGAKDALRDGDACRRYAAIGRKALADRVAREQSAK